MRGWAEFILRHRRWVMVFWLIVMVAGGVTAGKTTGRMTVDFSLPGQPGTEASDKIIAAVHNGGNTTPMLATITMPAGKTITGNEDAVSKAFDAVGANVKAYGAPVTNVRVIDEANTGDKAFRTKDDRTAYAMVFYPFTPSQTAKLPTELIRTAAESAKPAGSTVGVTGIDALALGDDSSGPGVLTETLLGAGGALLVLMFVFASVLAFLPLAVAAVSIMATFLMLLPLTYLTDVSFIVQFLVALVGLGVAIDYSLLLVTRWREERDHGKDNHEAVVAAMETAGHAVFFSGLTVAIGLLALIVLPVPFMRSIGMGGALIPFASVLVTLTFTPAILGGIGPRVDWPKIRHENNASHGWSRWARLIVRRRWIAAGAAFLALGLLFAAFLGIKIGAPSSDSLAKTGPAVTALHTLEKGGITTGALTPIEVLAKSDQASAVAAKLGKIDGIEAALVSTGKSSSANGQTVVVLIPDRETVNSKSVAVVKRVKAAADKTPGVI
ncbi:MAG: MMPL family transporter, partial [Aeromicrobium sp.]